VQLLRVAAHHRHLVNLVPLSVATEFLLSHLWKPWRWEFESQDCNSCIRNKPNP
jgi:hypothetical protein